MTDKTEAQPEALRLAEALYAESDRQSTGVKYSTAKKSAAELRRQHAEIEQLKAQLSARQAAPDGWRLVPESATLNMLDTAFGICDKNGRPVPLLTEAAASQYSAMLSAAPPPPEREPLTDGQIARAAVNAGMKPIYDKPKKPMVNALGSSVPFTWLKAFAHGIGATNDNH